MVGLPDGGKTLKIIICNRLHTIPVCDGQTDGLTGRQTDIVHTASRGKNWTIISETVNPMFYLSVPPMSVNVLWFWCLFYL